MSNFCPCCGQSIAPTKIGWDFTEWRITTEFGSVELRSLLQTKIFDLFYRRQGVRGLTRDRIKDIVYADDINGGPECERALEKVIQRVRKEVEKVGIHVKRGYAGGDGYSLIFTTPEQAEKLNKKQVEGMASKRTKITELEPAWMTRRRDNT